MMINTIIIIDGNDGGVTGGLLGIHLEWLHTLGSVIFVHVVAIDVIVVRSVLIDVRVPAMELVVNEVGVNTAIEDLFSADCDTVVDLLKGVLVVALSVNTCLLESATETLS